MQCITPQASLGIPERTNIMKSLRRTTSKLPKLLFIAISLALAPAALASTWYVDGVNGNDNNDCKSQQHACKTIGRAISRCSSGDSIMVAPATYKENLPIGRSLNIIGSSAATTIVDGGGKGTVFAIPIGVAVGLSGLTIRDGYNPTHGGGGVSNSSSLMVSNSIISGNSAGSLPGGGIYNLTGGKLIVVNSMITGNSAGAGGGIAIASGGTLTVINSTITGNTARGFWWAGGGGIAVATLSGKRGYFGGIGNSLGGTLTVNNSTISGNKAPNGLGGGIDGASTLQNTIVANNSGGNCHHTPTSKGYNLSSDGTCHFNGAGDMNNTDPKLGTLGNYGGPTPTIPLLAGSPAIDAGNPSGCTDGKGHLLKTDQRGYPRPDKEDASGCDMGAYERQSD